MTNAYGNRLDICDPSMRFQSKLSDLHASVWPSGESGQAVDNAINQKVVVSARPAAIQQAAQYPVGHWVNRELIGTRNTTPPAAQLLPPTLVSLDSPVLAIREYQEIQVFGGSVQARLQLWPRGCKRRPFFETTRSARARRANHSPGPCRGGGGEFCIHAQMPQLAVNCAACPPCGASRCARRRRTGSPQLVASRHPMSGGQHVSALLLGTAQTERVARREHLAPGAATARRGGRHTIE